MQWSEKKIITVFFFHPGRKTMVILRKNKHNKSYKKENYYIFNSNNRNKIFRNNPQSKEIAYRTEIIFVSYTWVR